VVNKEHRKSRGDPLVPISSVAGSTRAFSVARANSLFWKHSCSEALIWTLTAPHSPKKAPAAGRGFTYFWKYLVAPLVRKDVRSELEFATWLLCTP